MTADLQKHAREYLKSALMGTWAKTGRGVYQRSTGEIVASVGSCWAGGGHHWQSLYAAMSAIDYKHR